MEDIVFLAKIENLDKRNVIFYLDFKNKDILCENVLGVSNTLRDYVNNKYEDIKSVLTQEEFEIFYKIYNVKDKKKGIYNDIEKIITDKLLSEENKKLYEEIQEEEKVYIKKKYNLTDSDTEEIWKNYKLKCKDRNMVSCVYNNLYDMVEHTRELYGYDNVPMEFFNYKNFGNELLLKTIGNYNLWYKLPSGRIVEYLD